MYIFVLIMFDVHRKKNRLKQSIYLKDMAELISALLQKIKSLFTVKRVLQVMFPLRYNQSTYAHLIHTHTGKHALNHSPFNSLNLSLKQNTIPILAHHIIAFLCRWL